MPEIDILLRGTVETEEPLNWRSGEQASRRAAWHGKKIMTIAIESKDRTGPPNASAFKRGNANK
jgi:hypothetical protein